MKVKLGLLSGLLIILDQFTKYFVESHLDLFNHTKIINHFFYLTYARNTGAAWSIFSGKTIYLALISLVVSCILIYMFYRSDKTIEQWCYILLLSGAIGNLIDRIRIGYVVDFLDFYIFGYDFPIFNVADCCVTFGAFLFIYLLLKEEKWL